MSIVAPATDATTRARGEIERELLAFFERYAPKAAVYGAEFAHLWSLIAEQAQGGKLVRPLLLLHAYDAVTDAASPADDRQALRVAVAIEILHLAFLLHDDVIDDDTVRRGRPNLIGALAQTSGEGLPQRSGRHWARSGAILAGDLMLAAAHQMFARVEAAPSIREQLLDLLEHTVVETTAGELADVALGDGVMQPDLSSVLAMTTRKTATYTFELPLRTAVILAGGSAALEDALSAAGAHLGLAYQLQDDLLSTFGDDDLHGKQPFSDLREGKQTAIICFAQMTSAWPAIEPHFGDPGLTVETGRHLRALLAECGADGFVRGLIDEQMAAFSGVLATGVDSGTIPPRVRAVLLELARRIEGRRS